MRFKSRHRHTSLPKFSTGKVSSFYHDDNEELTKWKLPLDWPEDFLPFFNVEEWEFKIEFDVDKNQVYLVASSIAELTEEETREELLGRFVSSLTEAIEGESK